MSADHRFGDAVVAHDIPVVRRRRSTAAATGGRMLADRPLADRWLRRQLLVLLLVTFGVTSLLAGGHSYAIDNEVQFQTTRSLVNLRPDLTGVDQGWLDLSYGPYRVRDDGGIVAIVPVGQSIVSVPAYVISRVVAQLVPVDQRDQFVRTGTFMTNSLLHAFAAVVVALLALELLPRRRSALLLGFVYAFGTYALPNAKTYFTEGGTALFVAAACLFAIWSWNREDWRWAATSGASLGLAFLVRPSAGLFLPLVGLVLLCVVQRRNGWMASLRTAFAFGVPALAMLLVNAGFSWWRFGSPFDLGYQSVSQEYPILQGVANQMWSVGKGLIFYAPVVVLGLVGAVMALAKRSSAGLLLALLVAANTAFFGRVRFWSGDNSWGPRYTLIILPLLVALAAPVCAAAWGRTSVKVAGVVGFVFPALLGSLVNFNTLYIEANREIGTGGEVPAIQFDPAWQPILRHLGMLPHALADVADEDEPTDFPRPPYTRDPNADYGFFGVEPRIDVWWLWIGPTDASAWTWLFVLPSLAALAGAFVVLKRTGPRDQWAAESSSAVRNQFQASASASGRSASDGSEPEPSSRSSPSTTASS